MFDSLLKLFGGKSESSSEKAHKRLKFVLIHDRANVSPEVNSVVQRALSKKRKRRFASCVEFVDALTGKKPSRSFSRYPCHRQIFWAKK